MSNIELLIEEGFELAKQSGSYMDAAVKIAERELPGAAEFAQLLDGIRARVEHVRRDEFRSAVECGKMRDGRGRAHTGAPARATS